MGPVTASLPALAVAGGLAVVGLVGLADALYFVAVTYGWIRPDAAWIPRACRMDEATCARITDTTYGRALGLPNAAYGAVWYLLVLAAAALVATRGHLPACQVFLVAGAAAVLFSVFLVWALVQQLKVDCPLCYLGHGLNLTALVLMAVGCGLA